MWCELPLDLQNAIIELVYTPDASGYVHPRLMSHVPSKQFLHDDWCLELRRRLTCFARGRELASGYTTRKEIHEWVDAVTRVVVDVARLRASLPNTWTLALTAKVQRIAEEAFTQQGDNRLMWAALGYSPSVFHRSVAAERIHCSFLNAKDRERAIDLLDFLFCYLHKLPIMWSPQYVEYFRVRDVLKERVGKLYKASADLELRATKNL